MVESVARKKVQKRRYPDRITAQYARTHTDYETGILLDPALCRTCAYAWPATVYQRKVKAAVNHRSFASASDDLQDKHAHRLVVRDPGPAQLLRDSGAVAR